MEFKKFKNFIAVIFTLNLQTVIYYQFEELSFSQISYYKNTIK